MRIHNQLKIGARISSQIELTLFQRTNDGRRVAAANGAVERGQTRSFSVLP
jgi:hypothetical protein